MKQLTTKTAFFIVLLFVLLVVTIVKLFKKNFKNMTKEEALKQVHKEKGIDFARMTERLVRHETRHFESGQWKKGLTAGMENFSKTKSFPYGWTSLKKFTDENGISKSLFSTYEMTENGTGKIKTFVKFPNEGMFIKYLAHVISSRNNNFGSWFSTNAEKQKHYVNLLMKVTPRIVNTFE